MDRSFTNDGIVLALLTLVSVPAGQAAADDPIHINLRLADGTQPKSGHDADADAVDEPDGAPSGNDEGATGGAREGEDREHSTAPDKSPEPPGCPFRNQPLGLIV